MREALIGFAGVLVGALATGGFEYAFLKRREKTTLRAASRLLQQQLFTVSEAIYRHPREDFRSDAEPHDFSDVIETWRDTRGPLAEGLSGDAWESIVAAMEFVEVFDGTVEGQVSMRFSRERTAAEEDEIQRGVIDLLHRRLEKRRLHLSTPLLGESERNESNKNSRRHTRNRLSTRAAIQPRAPAPA
jgi:hypothetical protein